MTKPDHDLEALARSRGFPSYEAMAAFYRQRSNPEPTQGQGEPAKSGLMSLLGAIPIHPVHLLDYVLKKYNDATGQTP